MSMCAGFVLAMAAPPAGGGSFLQGIIPFVIILAIFYFIILLPMRRKQQKVQEFLDKLKEGDKVITTGGIYGQITKMNDQTITLQVADKIRIEVARASIGGYQGQPPVVDSAQ